MDRYKASIESVDNALNRLNQTLASYRLLTSDSETSPSPSSAPHPENTSDSSTSVLSQDLEKKVNGSSNVTLPSAASKATPAAELSEIDQLILALRSTNQYPERNVFWEVRVWNIRVAHDRLEVDPYCVPAHLVLAIEYLGYGYPDLAAGAAYKALLLSDAIDDEAEEYHNEASESLKNVIQTRPLEERIEVIRMAMSDELERSTPSQIDPSIDVEVTVWMRNHYRLIMYRILTRSLLLCGSLRSALEYIIQARMQYADDELKQIHDTILEVASRLGYPHPGVRLTRLKEWPDQGFVRREQYPWNLHEPDRLNMLDQLNVIMREIGPKLEVKRAILPALAERECDYNTQLGIFAKEDIAPGEEILNETSVLTANNKLRDALCETCSAELPPFDGVQDTACVCCEDCSVTFCCQLCCDIAMECYHPPLCGKDVDAIAKDVAPSEAADSLYALLLLRTLAISETTDGHPLDIPEIKFIWSDFSPPPNPDKEIFPDFSDPDSCTVARTLPFSFDHNVRLPLHMLEKMEIDIFAEASRYDIWIFNTLYAKFRGTASARLSGLGGRPIRGPEVSAVHPMWCLANHSCDPNVSWEWGGSITFTARSERVTWNDQNGQKIVRSKAGIKKGEEILNHYCDINLPVKERREWARGALGGDCRCPRCKWEANEEKKDPEAEEAEKKKPSDSNNKKNAKRKKAGTNK